MPNWIYNLSDDGIIALVTSVVVVITTLGLVAGRFIFRVRLDREYADSLSNAYRLVVTLAALVLAFSLVQAQTNLRETQAMLRREASTIDGVDRNLLQIGTPVAAALRVRLFDYANGILQDEWPTMENGQANRQVDAFYDALMRETRAAAASQSIAGQAALGDAIHNLDQLDDFRDARLSAATLRLPTPFWHTIEALVAFSILIAAAIPWTVPHTISTILTSAALGVLIALTIVIDVPFKGESAVKPVELKRVLSQMVERNSVGYQVPSRG